MMWPLLVWSCLPIIYGGNPVHSYASWGMCGSSIITTFTQQSAFTVCGASFTLKFKCNFNLLGSAWRKSQVKMYSSNFKYHILVMITFFFKFNYAKLKGCSDENIEYLELCHKVRSMNSGVSNYTAH